ncbi:MAG: isovaleryl-CoA dehydrogenase [Telmatospirillum sp.]|nr:isovaleryl-CoA dehydrogenase [Telmatospirillum sp.]
MPIASFETHQVTNQPPLLADRNLFLSDPALCEAVRREGAEPAWDGLVASGRLAGSSDCFDAGRLANDHPPQWRGYDRFGHRRDEIEFHPAWHGILTTLLREGAHAAPWAEPGPGAHVARAARYVMFSQSDCGALCPVTMTFSAVPVLRRAGEAVRDWLPRVLSRRYDPRFLPADQKTAVMIGMGMTEKQGGSDVRSNSTVAIPAGGGDGAYLLKGHKWFLSAPMCDAFLVTARAPGGMTCFLLPRWRPDGTLNAVRIRRLKDKLGNRSNASAEVEFEDAWALRVSEEGRGIPTIIEMAAVTRLDCILGTAGLMRQALSQAAFHAAHRTAFQRHLIDQPLMRGVLADLAVETEAAIALGLRLARTFDEDTEDSRALCRVMTPAGKFWVCKRGPAFAAEAMEVLGGAGYVEEAPLARIYREMPVNSIWEGSGNVMCLDLLRALGKGELAREAVLAELRPALGMETRFDRHVARLKDDLAVSAEADGRRLAAQLVLALQAALLLRSGPAAVAEAFCASRFGGEWGTVAGLLPAGLDPGPIIDRSLPAG